MKTSYPQLALITQSAEEREASGRVARNNQKTFRSNLQSV